MADTAEIDACPLTCLNRLAPTCVIHRPSAEKDAHGLRKCFPKTGWLSAERYCAVHGRGAGWPCKIGTSPRVIPPGEGRGSEE